MGLTLVGVARILNIVRRATREIEIAYRDGGRECFTA